MILRLLRISATITVLLCAAQFSSAQSTACLVQKLESPIGTGYGLWDVSISGSRLTSAHGVAAGQKFGVVGVFERTGSQWTEVARVAPSPFVATITFGASLRVDGVRLVVGAPMSPGPQGQYGALYIFERASAETWLQVAKLSPGDLGEFDLFGSSVAVSGDIAAVGAPYQSSPVYSAGAIYVFERDASGVWSQKAKLAPASLTAGAKLGWSLACHGNIIVAGAPFDSTLGFGAGAAYVFERDPNGVWLENGKLFASDEKVLDNFGTSVATWGEELLVGSVSAKYGGQSHGAAYVFQRQNDGSWKETGKLFPSSLEFVDKFGCSVAIEAGLAVIGADAEISAWTGAAYVFAKKPNGSWCEVAKLQPDDLQPHDTFGDDVALSGNIACVRTWPQDAQNPKAASVYIFAVGPDLNSNGLMDPCECPGDLNKDWIVDQADLGLLLANWGCTGGLGYEPSTKPCPGAITACCGDLDADGDVDQADLGVMLQNFGNLCP